MTRLSIIVAFVCVTVQGAWAQSSDVPAQIIAEESSISQGWSGQTTIDLSLTRGVPFRVFTLDSPPRLVVDFRHLDADDLSANTLLADNSGFDAARFGTFQPGWVRLVADMARPMLPSDIGLSTNDDNGRARLAITLVPADADDFASKSGAPDDALWPVEPAETLQQVKDDNAFIIVIDPGHGGVDPGAERQGLSEKVLMLDVALHLRDLLLSKAGLEVYLTRQDDRFVSLDARVALAHQVGADLFLSLHADALSEGGATGATVYTLSSEASDAASAQLAARHNRTDLISGVDLTTSDDEIAGILLDLARLETDPRSDALAGTLVKAMAAAGGPMNKRPLREAGFAVLKSADIPSVLVEIGFLSSARDLENIANPEWRTKMVEALADGIMLWHDLDVARRAQMRQ